MKKGYYLLSGLLLLASVQCAASCNNNNATSENKTVDMTKTNSSTEHSNSSKPSKHKNKISFVDVGGVDAGIGRTAWETFREQGFQVTAYLENEVEEWILIRTFDNADVHIRVLFYGNTETNDEVYMTIKTQGNMDEFITDMMNHYTFLYGEPLGVDETDTYIEKTWHLAEQNRYVNLTFKDNLIELKIQWQRE